MKKFYFFTIVLLLATVLFACAAEGNGEALLESNTDYSGEIGINSPEGLAKASSSMYMNMISGKLSAEEGFATLLGYVAEPSVKQMTEMKDQFIKEIGKTKEYFEANNDRITDYEFAETIYKNENEASINRIQKCKSGSAYYFKQDFIKEDDGQWKIKGDNLVDAFKIKKKFLFWYI